MLESIGGIALVILVFYLLTNHANKRSQEDSYYDKLENDAPEELKELTKNAKDEYEYRKIRRKYYSNPYNLNKVLEVQKERELRNNKFNDIRRKKEIINRNYAYQYEEIVFDIFIDGDSFSQDDLVKEIQERMSLNYDKSLKLLKEWEDHDVINQSYLSKIPTYILGYALSHYVNVISENDLTLQKWIEKKNFISKKQYNLEPDVIKEIESFHNKSPRDKVDDKSLLMKTLGDYISEDRKWRFISCTPFDKYEIQSIEKVKVEIKGGKKIIQIYYNDNTSEHFPVLFNSNLKANYDVDLKSLKKITLCRAFDSDDEMILIDGEIKTH